MFRVKAVCFTLIAAFTVMLSGMYAFAAGGSGDIKDARDAKDVKDAKYITITYNKNTPETEQFIVNITRPAENESIFARSYIICGNTRLENVRAELYIFSEDEDCYIPFKNVDGEISWKIGKSGFFSKELELKKGANRIMIAAYRTSDPDVKQFSKFTITVLDESIKDIIKNGINKTINFFRSLF